MKKLKTAFITGATSGIGKAVAEIFAQNGYRIIITGRRKDRLVSLQKELQNKYPENLSQILPFDIQEKTQVQNAWDSLEEQEGNWQDIDVLVNNAGLAAGLDPIHSANIDDWERMIDTNIKGLLYVSKLVSQNMIRRRQGHIIHVSSIAGKQPYPNGGVYCGSKHAVEAIARAMRIELLPYSIKVSSIAPGLVDTEFSTVRFHGDEKRAAEVYQNITPLSAQDIAETIWFMANRPAHVNIEDLTIFPVAQGSARDVYRNESQNETKNESKTI